MPSCLAAVALVLLVPAIGRDAAAADHEARIGVEGIHTWGGMCGTTGYRYDVRGVRCSEQYTSRYLAGLSLGYDVSGRRGLGLRTTVGAQQGFGARQRWEFVSPWGDYGRLAPRDRVTFVELGPVWTGAGRIAPEVAVGTGLMRVTDRYDRRVVTLGSGAWNFRDDIAGRRVGGPTLWGSLGAALRTGGVTRLRVAVTWRTQRALWAAPQAFDDDNVYEAPYVELGWFSELTVRAEVELGGRGRR